MMKDSDVGQMKNDDWLIDQIFHRLYRVSEEIKIVEERQK